MALSTSAQADVLMWDLLADCSQGAKEVKLKMTYSIADYWFDGDPMDKSKVLYACGGTCAGPHELATPITWKEVGTSCWCMMSGKEVPTQDDCPQGDYAKCSATMETTLPYSCNELAYTKICSSSTCEPGGNMTYGPSAVCAELEPLAAADQCLAHVAAPIKHFMGLGSMDGIGEKRSSLPADPDGVDVDVDEGGCSISIGAANVSLLTLLLFAAGLSLLVSRRRQGR
jgi:hypothetical protein